MHQEICLFGLCSNPGFSYHLGRDILYRKLPQFPLPTHNVVVRGHSPREFEIFVQHIKTLLSGLKLCTSFRRKGAS
ncbi:hypothetical protein ACET3Z_019907 [Daucus carota]